MEIKYLTIPEDASLRQAIETVNDNGLGIVFVVDKNNGLAGLLSDGDIRRLLLNGKSFDTPVEEVMNTNFFSLPVETDNAVVLQHLNERIKIIPLVDKEGKLVDYASINKIRRIPIASPLLSGNELAYVTDCIKTNWISSQGKYVKKFEELFSGYHQDTFALAVCNGTVALHLALVALGIKEGDEVIVPDLTFAASVNAILYTGAIPVLAEIDINTWNIDTSKIRQLITARTKAIMPVHLYGCPCDMNEIMQIAKEFNLLIIEDCAEALGSAYKGMPVGIFGDAATFSFYGNKTITTGEGGMILFKDKKIAERAAMLRDHGMQKTKRYWHEEVGYNYRLTNIQAAIGVAQFERLDEFVSAKRNIADKYTSTLSEIPFVQIPVQNADCINSYWLYTFLVNKDSPFTRDDLMEYLQLHGIETRPVFYPMHVMPPYTSFGKSEQLKISALVANCGISLPSSVNLTAAELDHICNTIRSYCKKFVTSAEYK